MNRGEQNRVSILKKERDHQGKEAEGKQEGGKFAGKCCSIVVVAVRALEAAKNFAYIQIFAPPQSDFV